MAFHRGIVRFASRAILGGVFALTAASAQPARAADDYAQQVGAAIGAAPRPATAVVQPLFDMSQFDSESGLRAVFMTTILGFVVFGRAALRQAKVAAVPPARAVVPVHALAEEPEAVVWLNTRTGVTHEPGTRWYGKTAEGKYVPKRLLAA